MGSRYDENHIGFQYWVKPILFSYLRSFQAVRYLFFNKKSANKNKIRAFDQKQY